MTGVLVRLCIVDRVQGIYVQVCPFGPRTASFVKTCAEADQKLSTSLRRSAVSRQRCGGLSRHYHAKDSVSRPGPGRAWGRGR